MVERLNIKDLEHLSGIKAHTIRIWEKRYNLFDPERSETNIRSYSNEDLKKLLNVVTVLDSGKRISQVCSMSEQSLHSELEKIQSLSVEQHNKMVVNDLIYATLNCNAVKFNTLFQEKADAVGLEATIEDVIYPFLRRIGLMWTVSKLNPSQEHFASQQIRQKLFAAIDKLPLPASQGQKWMLFLPENEHHEIALLYSYYIIKKAGKEVLYLGPDLPVKHAVDCVQRSGANHLMCFFTIGNKSKAAERYVSNLVNSFHQENVFYSGLPVEYANNLPENFCRLDKIDDLRELL